MPRTSQAYFNTRFLETDIRKKSLGMADIVPHLPFLPVEPQWSHVLDTMAVLLGPVDAANINVWRTGTET